MAATEEVIASVRVLIVEDDATAATLLARALRKHAYRVETAASIRQALDISESWQPQAAVVDLRLGKESGLKLVPELVSRHPGIRILVLTGYASITTAVQAIKMGAADYLAKPVEVAEILEVLAGDRLHALREPSLGRLSVRRFEWEYIQKVLAEHDGNISETARVLGMQRRTLQRKLAKRPMKT